MSSRPSWRPLIVGTVGLFLIILAFLAGQLRAGADPSVGTRSTPATQQTTERAAPGAPPQAVPGLPDQDAPSDGFGPGGSDGTSPDDLTPSAAPPATHQS
jgi:hypothetical protein